MKCSLVPRPHPRSPIAREGLVTSVDFLGPVSNIFRGMSGIESDWSEGQLLRNANHIDRIMILKSNINNFQISVIEPWGREDAQ